MIWLLAIGALLVAGTAGYLAARRWARTGVAAAVLSAAALIVSAAGAYQALMRGDGDDGIVWLSAGFGALTGIRLGSEVVSALLRPVPANVPLSGSDESEQSVELVGLEVDADAVTDLEGGRVEPTVVE